MGRETSFRQQLIEQLAATQFVRLVATRGQQDGLAEKLGVQPEVLEAAVVLARAGFAPIFGTGPRFVEIAVFAPALVARALVALATTLGMSHVQLTRSALHAVMRTEREPMPRPSRHWEPFRGCEDARRELDVVAQSLAPVMGSNLHMTVPVSIGLKNALELRAMAVGLSRSQYVLRWLADLVDGLLRDMRVPPLDVAETYDDERAYVLPLLPDPPAAAEPSR